MAQSSIGDITDLYTACNNDAELRLEIKKVIRKRMKLERKKLNKELEKY